MSINFAGIPAQSYIGAPYGIPVQIAGNAGRAVPISINWLVYGASTANSAQGINLSLFGQNVSLLSRVKSIYIDNNGSNVPIYVVATDTGHTISAAANQAVWAPIITNGFQFQIFGIGFIDGFIPQTQIFFTDILIHPATDVSISQSLDLWLASPLLQRENTLTLGYGVPALGDQIFNTFLPITGETSVPLMPLNTTAEQFLYITDYSVYGSGLSTAEVLTSYEVTLVNSVDGVVSRGLVTLINGVTANGIIQQFRGNVKFGPSRNWQIGLEYLAGTALNSGALALNITYTKGNF